MDFSNFHWDKIIPLQHLNISGYFSQFTTTVAKKKNKIPIYVLKFYLKFILSLILWYQIIK